MVPLRQGHVISVMTCGDLTNLHVALTRMQMAMQYGIVRLNGEYLTHYIICLE